MRIGNESGTAPNTNAVILLETEATPRIIRGITLYNPNGGAADFILRYHGYNTLGDEMIIRRYDEQIAATDEWTFGEQGAVMVVPPMTRVELVLDSDPTTPIEWSVDWAE